MAHSSLMLPPRSYDVNLTSSPAQVRTYSMPNTPNAGLDSSPSLPVSPPKMTLRERLSAGKSPHRSLPTESGESDTSPREQQSREPSFDTMSNDSFTSMPDDMSDNSTHLRYLALCLCSNEHAPVGSPRVSIAGEEEEEEMNPNYVGSIELPSLTYLNLADNSLELIPRELNLASCTRLKKVPHRP